MKILKIGAEWCPGCIVMQGRWEEIEREMPELVTEYIDFDQNQSRVEHFGLTIINLPTFVFLDDNEHVITQLVGEMPKNKLLEVIEEVKGSTQTA